MALIKVKEHEFEAITIRDSFNRRAVQLKNNIILRLKKLGITEDDIEIDLEPNAMKKAPASISWYFDKSHLFYSYSSRDKYVENLYVVLKVIEFLLEDLFDERISVEEFIREFSEEKDIKKVRKDARIRLGLDPETNDLKLIDKAYKDLARKHHPDTENGDLETFKEINSAHQILKRELM